MLRMGCCFRLFVFAVATKRAVDAELTVMMNGDEWERIVSSSFKTQWSDGPFSIVSCLALKS